VRLLFVFCSSFLRLLFVFFPSARVARTVFCSFFIRLFPIFVFSHLPASVALVEYTFSLFTFHFSLLFVSLPPKNI
ncbi:hypothetical protein HMPREF9072_02489, partial [Capnocytophaga sp. oral taxon 324 str. F0483]